MQQYQSSAFLQKYLVRKPFELIRILGNTSPIYPQKLHKQINVTYSHIFNIIKLLEAHNIITTRKSGRVRNLRLTIKGKAILDHIEGIYTNFSNLDRAIVS